MSLQDATLHDCDDAPVSASPSPRALPQVGADCALFLDVDGCLLEFADTPDAVVVPPSLVALLDGLQRKLDGALALVSGRTIDELDRLFAPLRLATAGQHGFEWRFAEAPRRGAPQPPIAVVDAVRHRCGQVLHDLGGVRLEDKGYSFALHYRAVPDAGPALGARVRDIAAASDGSYVVQPGTLVYELKPATCSKGAALRAFCREAPFRGRVPVMLGDDLTDESAFMVANERGGISVRVGPATHASHARYALTDPFAARAWLGDLLRSLSTEASGG
jgi:trehalose 6-phosphate phosphatase